MKARIILLLSFLLVTGAVQAQSYVAIGDSLAFGFQKAKFYSLFLTGNYDPSSFNTGFVELIDNFLRPDWPTLHTANFSCPGETTATLVAGGCPLHNWLFALPLHQDYPGATPQIYAAVEYLQAHPNEVLFITVTIGANDILNVFSDCGGDIACVEQNLPATTAGAAQTLGTVLQSLNMVSPQSVILYTNVPNPYTFTNPASMAAFEGFNAAMSTAATNAGARVVDWFGGMKNFDQATFCLLTYVCEGPLYDIHPTDIGYQIMAVQTVQTLVQ